MGKINDITGQRFGKLVALVQVATEITPTGNSHTRWLFKCDCGNEKVIRKRNIVNMGHTSCGCQRFYLDKSIPNLNALYTDYRKRAKYSNLGFTITIEQFQKLTKQNCFYCDKEPSQSYCTETNTPYVYNGLDRVDSALGYTLDNIVTCCKSCNYAKHVLTQKEFFDMIKRIYEHLKLNT